MIEDQILHFKLYNLQFYLLRVIKPDLFTFPINTRQSIYSTVQRSECTIQKDERTRSQRRTNFPKGLRPSLSSQEWSTGTARESQAAKKRGSLVTGSKQVVALTTIHPKHTTHPQSTTTSTSTAPSTTSCTSSI